MFDLFLIRVCTGIALALHMLLFVFPSLRPSVRTAELYLTMQMLGFLGLYKDQNIAFIIFILLTAVPWS